MLGALVFLCPAAGAADLEQLMRGMADSRGVVADFREVKHIALLTEPIETRGRLYFVPPDRMLRESHAPVKSRLVVDGDRVRMEQPGRVMDLSESAMARGFVENFVVLWSGDLEALRERYQVRFGANASGWEMTLQPRDPTLRRVIETISLRGSSETLQEIETREVDGDRTLMILETVDRDHVFEVDELEKLFPAAVLPADRS